MKSLNYRINQRSNIAWARDIKEFNPKGLDLTSLLSTLGEVEGDAPYHGRPYEGDLNHLKPR